MTISTIDESQRKAARVAGFAYLFTFVIVVLVNFGIHERLMVAGNAAIGEQVRRCAAFGQLALQYKRIEAQEKAIPTIR